MGDSNYLELGKREKNKSNFGVANNDITELIYFHRHQSYTMLWSSYRIGRILIDQRWLCLVSCKEQNTK